MGSRCMLSYFLFFSFVERERKTTIYISKKSPSFIGDHQFGNNKLLAFLLLTNIPEV
jgi:hypothetical protein